MGHKQLLIITLLLIVIDDDVIHAAPHDDAKITDVTEEIKSINGGSGGALTVDEPKYWRAILGDICQLPSFPRATGDPTRYVECIRQTVDTGNRKDLGIWLLRECLPGYEFVASARRCKTVRSVVRQQQICDGPNADNYQFCPNQQLHRLSYVVREIRQAPKQCACPNGESNCVCPTPEILEPIAVVPAVDNKSSADNDSDSYKKKKNETKNATISNRNTSNDIIGKRQHQRAQTKKPKVTETTTVRRNDDLDLGDAVIIEQSEGESQSSSPPLVAMAQTSYTSCPCPVQMPNCICVVSSQQEQTQPPVAMAQLSSACICPPAQPQCTMPPQCQPVAQQPMSVLTAPPMMLPLPTPSPAVCPCPQQPNCQCPPQQQQPACQTTTTSQTYCPQQQAPVVQPQPCPLVQGGVQNAQYQGICSWMIDPLAADPTSRKNYLQCQPAPNNLFCGRWQRMPCAPSTVFDVSAQVCVWDSNGQPGTIPAPQPYVPAPSQQPTSQCSCTGGVQIGSCNQNYQCPGQSVCQVAQQPQQSQPCMVCCYFRTRKQ